MSAREREAGRPATRLWPGPGRRLRAEMVPKTRLLSYGEDALTLWAVTERLDLILGEL